MDSETLKQLMQNYDFFQNTIKSFALKYGCSERYVHYKIREYNIPFNKRVRVVRNKDIFGQFTFKNVNNAQNNIQTNIQNKTQKVQTNPSKSTVQHKTQSTKRDLEKYRINSVLTKVN